MQISLSIHENICPNGTNNKGTEAGTRVPFLNSRQRTEKIIFQNGYRSQILSLSTFNNSKPIFPSNRKEKLFPEKI